MRLSSLVLTALLALGACSGSGSDPDTATERPDPGAATSADDAFR